MTFDGVSKLALVADAGEHRHGRVTDAARQRVVVEPGQVVHGAATADDHHRVRHRARRPGAQRFKEGGADQCRSTIALKAAVGVDEAAHAQALQPLRLGMEVAQARRAFGGDHQHRVEVPGRGQAAVGVEDTLALQPLADLALACLEVAQRVLRVDGVDLQAEAVDRVHRGLGAHEQLDARGQHHAGGALEGRQDRGRRGGPDHGAGLRHGGPLRVALGKFQVDMAAARVGTADLDPRPDAAAIGLRHGAGHPLHQLRQRDALGHRQLGGCGAAGRRRRRCRLWRPSRQPGLERDKVQPRGDVPAARAWVPARAQRLDPVLVLEGGVEVGQRVRGGTHADRRLAVTTSQPMDLRRPQWSRQ